MMDQTINEIRKLKKERQELIEFVNALDKRLAKKEITSYERDFLIKTMTKGSTAKAYLYELNKKLSGLEEKNNVQSKRFVQQFKYTKHLVVSSIMIVFFLVSFYTFLYGSTTGLFVLDNVKEYDVVVNQTINESMEFYFRASELTNNTLNLTSLKITGSYAGNFAVYLIKDDENGREVFKIYSSGDMKSISSITGFAAGTKKDISLPDNIIDDNEESIDSVIEEPVVEEIIEDVEVPIVDEENTDVPVVEAPIVDEEPIEQPIIDTPIIEDIVDEEYGEKYVFFNNKCADTCDIELSPYNLSIFIEIAENSSLHVDYITFSQRIENVIPETINETMPEIINETINATINETINTTINETLITNQTINLEKIDPELLKELNSKEKVRVIIQKNGELKTVYIGSKDVSKNKKNTGAVATQSEEVSYDEIKSRMPSTRDLTEEELLNYQDKKLLDKNTKKPIEIEQETADIIASTTDIEQLTELSLMTEVEYITIDREFSTLTIDSMNITKILDSQNLGYSGEGVNVCILDTGYTGQTYSGYNFVDDNEDYSDNNGHGTKVVYPLIQSAPNVNLIIAKVISDSGIGYASDIIAGIEYCVQQNASIISASIGGGGFDGYCDEDIVASKINDIALNNNILTIASSGNDGNALVKSPACARNALAVASSTKNDTLAPFSNYNGATLLVAPGENIQTIDTNGNVVLESGTSMSVPFVTATAAMILQNNTLNESFTAEQLKRRIINTGEIIEHPVVGLENNYRRFSRLNTYNAIINNVTNELLEANVFVAYGQAQNFTTMAWAGFYEPSTVSEGAYGGIVWTNIGSAGSYDSTYAESREPFDPGSVYFETVKLIVSDTLTGNNNAATSPVPTEPDTSTTFGSSTDKWGVALTPGIINSATFGVGIAYADEMAAVSEYIMATDYASFNIPAGASITGVEANIYSYIDTKGSYAIFVDGMQLKVYYEFAISAKGTSNSWTWNTVNGINPGNIVSGTPYDWTWRAESSGSGRMVRNGTPYNWNWVPE